MSQYSNIPVKCGLCGVVLSPETCEQRLVVTELKQSNDNLCGMLINEITFTVQYLHKCELDIDCRYVNKFAEE